MIAAGVVAVCLLLCIAADANATGKITVNKAGLRDTSSDDTDSYASPLSGATFEYALCSTGACTSAYGGGLAGLSDAQLNALTWNTLCTTGGTGACTGPAANVANGNYVIREKTAPAGWDAVLTNKLAYGGGSDEAQDDQQYVAKATIDNGNVVTPEQARIVEGSEAEQKLFMDVKNNKPFPSQCGMKVMLLLDKSGSIASQKTQYASAANKFVDSLTNTPTTLKIGSFNTSASFEGGGTGTTFSLDTGAAAPNAAGAHAAIGGGVTGDGGIYASPSGGTSWDAGLQIAAQANVDVVIMITDGNPTARDGDTGSTGTVNLGDLTYGIASANLAKNAFSGQKVFAVGVGAASTITKNNLRDISGPNEFPANTTNPDYASVSNATALGDSLKQIANLICGARIHLRKYTDGDDNPQNPRSGWNFDATKPANPMSVSLTPSTETTTSVLPIEDEDVIRVDGIPLGGAPGITVTEDPTGSQSTNYDFVASQCVKANPVNPPGLPPFPAANSGGALTQNLPTINRGDDYWCTWRNKHKPRNPSISTNASNTVVVGGNISDSASLTGGYNPTGTITFRLYGPDDATCSGASIFTPVVNVNGNGSYGSGNFLTTTAGTYRWRAFYSGDANNNAVSGACNANNESVVVTKKTPAIVTQASAAVNLGGQVSDTATMSGLVNPTGAGTITFKLYGPNDATCAGAAVATLVANNINANGSYGSGNFSPTTAGTYRWIATFSGDANNNSVAGACNAANESVVVNKKTPAIATTSSATVVVGGNISDTATMSGLVNPSGGTITFKLYGPNDTTCANPAIATLVANNVNANGNYGSGNFTTTQVGTYRWIASYSGDANNNAVAGSCNDANESVVVTKKTPAIVTNASSGVVVGGNISDTATMSGLVNPSGGTITFKLYGPNDTNCSNPAIATLIANNINANTSYGSGNFATTQAGIYRWVASYSGDANNNAVAGNCNDANESVRVDPKTPAIVTNASANVAVGGNISDTATMSGLVNPTGAGTITFKLYGPNDATCANAALATLVASNINANGNYGSGNFTTTQTGTYRWVASFSGDANNNAVAGNCNDANESVVVGANHPAISTTATPNNVVVGSNIHDVATMSGLVNPTGAGTITFKLYPPSDATCAGAGVATFLVTNINANGNYNSPDFATTDVGTYRWIATFSGDANNSGVAGTCTSANEQAVVTKKTPAIATNASNSVTVGGNISDTATMSGLVNPTGAGTITFKLYGPNDTTCANAAIATLVANNINANGSYGSGNFTTTQTGTYRWVASFSGDANNNAVAGNCNDANESVVVDKKTPAIATNASNSVTVGGNISDTATMSGLVNPTGAGTITFKLYGPNDGTCANAAIATLVANNVNANGSYGSGNFTTTQTGTYRWVASFSGDANNNAVAGNCNDANESVVVDKKTPAIATNASNSVTVGGNISDTATMSGLVNPTGAGTITFKLYGPNDTTCANAAIATLVANNINANASYGSGNFTTTQTGTYRWVASFSGDANNNAVAGNCNDANESVVVGANTPSISTTATPNNVVVGSNIHDVATMSGLVNPTGAGTITFKLYPPSDANCSGAGVATFVVNNINANGNYNSPDFATTDVGTYRWIATFSGDANNSGVAGNCTSANEQAVVTKKTPAITTNASATVTVGGDISDTATLSGGFNPTGTITFKLYGPNDNNCSNAALATLGPVNVAGNGNYGSGNFTTTQVGTYRWVASYSGDAKNVAVTGACNDANESVVVTKKTPAIATNASNSVTVGGNISDTATMSGLVNPTGAGTITFKLYGPNDGTCANAAIATLVANNVNANGNYGSGNFQTFASGTYRWVASFSGDANNNAVAGNCNDANESVVVNSAGPAISTNASSSVTVGGNIHDTATLSGGFNPTGTITFKLYGPNDTNCSDPAVDTSNAPVSGNGNYDSANFSTTLAGTYRWIASYSGDINNAPVTGACNDANESVVVTKKTPEISTNASAPVTVGGKIKDTATLSGGQSPTGTITFKLYGPNDTNCSDPAVDTSNASVSGNGNYDSAEFTTTQTGTYRWIASYSGDANNEAVTGACNDANESVVVNNASPSISTNASSSVTVGGNIHDTATLSGGVTPTGSITFKLYGPNDTNCSDPAIDTSNKTVTGNGDYDSADFATTQAGTYRWVASYSGDANNNAVTGACNDSNESVVVTKKSPSISTNASSSVTVGGNIHDTATLSDGYNPTGSITFKLYGPNDNDCSDPAIDTSNKTVTGNGDYDSADFATTQTGTYRWVASYSGDGNNEAVSGSCNDSNESVVVTKKTPGISTNASAAVTVGGKIKDVATLSGGVTPTGSITFKLYGPNDNDCSDPAIDTSNKTVTGNGDYDSAEFTTTQTGTYRWIASYSGDGNNEAVSGSCNDANESVVVNKQQPKISTNASDAVRIPGKIHDTAHLSDGFSPTGTITFKLYGPGDDDCSDPAIETFVVDVTNGNGDYVSPDYTATVKGIYHWIASYSGDGNNEPIAGACNDANESVVAFDPSIKIVKSGPATGHDNQNLVFNYEVTNTGDIPLHNVTVVDDKCSPVTGPTKQNSNGDDLLDPIGTDNTTSEKWTFTCTIPGAAVHGLENGDKLIINTATTTGKDPNDGEVTDTDTHTTAILHPAIAIDKTGPATATAGSVISYTLDVTNPGQVSFADSKVVVTDPRCDAAPTLTTKNGDGTPGTFDPGDRWTYNCNVTTKVGDTIVNNVGNVTGTDDYGNVVTASDPADTTLEQPVPVTPQGKALGSAALKGPTGCVSKTFKASIKGSQVQKVVYYVDGKKYKTVTKAPYSLKFKTRKFGKGVHRVTAKVTYLPSANTQPATLKMVFQKCKARKIKPKFTG